MHALCVFTFTGGSQEDSKCFNRVMMYYLLLNQKVADWARLCGQWALRSHLSTYPIARVTGMHSYAQHFTQKFKLRSSCLHSKCSYQTTLKGYSFSSLNFLKKKIMIVQRKPWNKPQPKNQVKLEQKSNFIELIIKHRRMNKKYRVSRR